MHLKAKKRRLAQHEESSNSETEGSETSSAESSLPVRKRRRLALPKCPVDSTTSDLSTAGTKEAEHGTNRKKRRYPHVAGNWSVHVFIEGIYHCEHELSHQQKIDLSRYCTYCTVTIGEEMICAVEKMIAQNPSA